MKAILIAIALLVCAPAFAQRAYRMPTYHAPKSSYSYRSSYSTTPVHVSGYTTRRGTYVDPSYRTTPNQTRTDNWSSKTNVNPFTGKPGTKDPYSLGH